MMVAAAVECETTRASLAGQLEPLERERVREKVTAARACMCMPVRGTRRTTNSPPLALHDGKRAFTALAPLSRKPPSRACRPRWAGSVPRLLSSSRRQLAQLTAFARDKWTGLRDGTSCCSVCGDSASQERDVETRAVKRRLAVESTERRRRPNLDGPCARPRRLWSASRAHPLSKAPHPSSAIPPIPTNHGRPVPSAAVAPRPSLRRRLGN